MFIVYASIWNIDNACHAIKYSIIIERRICQLNNVYNIFISIEFFYCPYAIRIPENANQKSKIKNQKKRYLS